MANTPESVQFLWKRLEANQVKIPVTVWIAWQDGCLRVLEDVCVIVRKSAGRPIPVADAEAISRKTELLQKFYRGIRRSSDGINQLCDGGMLMEATARELVAHYLGNDLFKIALLADVYGQSHQPLPPENGENILKNVQNIRDFVEQLKSRTR